MEPQELPDDSLELSSAPSLADPGAAITPSTDLQVSQPTIQPAQLFRVGLMVEFGLVFVALAAALLFAFFDHQRPMADWLQGNHWLGQLAVGSLLAVPMLFVMLYVLPMFDALKPFFEFVDKQLSPMFRGLSVWQIALISLSAGVGEEILFRWCLMGGLDQFLSLPAAVAISSVVFGLAHCVNVTYFLITFFMGIVLAGIYLYFGPLAAIACHAVYDFLALAQITKQK